MCLGIEEVWGDWFMFWFLVCGMVWVVLGRGGGGKILLFGRELLGWLWG